MNKKLFKEVHNELTRLADFIMKNFQEDIKDKQFEGELVVDTAIRLLKKYKNRDFLIKFNKFLTKEKLENKNLTDEYYLLWFK